MDSSFSRNGKTFFTANIESSSGGDIYVETRSNISVGEDTWFLDNEADVDDEAACVYVSHDTTPSYFILDNNLAVPFQGNTCGGNSVAIEFIGEVFARSDFNMTFVNNSTGIFGGATYMSGVTVGMRFEAVVFKSNSAIIGGELYLTGSGTAVTEDVYGNPEHSPTTFFGCEFMGKKALKTGEAMDSTTATPHRSGGI